jgi:predicted secreted Zn-dependent protease
MAQPDTIIEDRVVYYDVGGASAPAIRASLDAGSPVMIDGRTYDAYTHCDISWQYQWWQTDAACRMTSVTTRVKITMTLPRHVNPKVLPAGLQRRWFDYRTALEDHEDGHRTIGIAAARAIGRDLMALGVRPDCEQLARAAEDRARTIVSATRNRDRQYDADTEFGALTGAVFP